MIPTAHIEITDKNLVAKTVLMPGDPLRAKFVADNFLSEVKLINSIRGMLGFTGFHHGKQVTVMGSGMGMPSIGIYSYELFKFYDVDNIIRIGSCGSYTTDLNIHDIVVATDAYSESTYALAQTGNKSNVLVPSAQLNQHIANTAKTLSIPIKFARVHSTDVFYRNDPKAFENILATHKAEVVEMEAFALFANADVLAKNAACILTVSDSLVTHEATTALERQNAFTKMMELALAAC